MYANYFPRFPWILGIRGCNPRRNIGASGVLMRLSRWMFLVGLACAAGFAGVLAAQSRGASQGMRVRLLVFGRIVGPETLILVNSEKPEESREVKLHLNNFTGPYRAPSRRVVLAEPGGADGAKPKVVAKIAVPTSYGSQVLLVLVPNGGKASGYQVIPVRDNRVGFAPGERRLVNLTHYALGGQFDGKKVLVKPKSVTSLKLRKPPGGRETHEVVVYFRAKDKAPWAPLTSTVWPYDPEARSLVFFYWSSAEKRIRIQSIAEVPAAEKAPKGGAKTP